MFKIESYITPVILSYVEKYVKNFKPEQSQVSLWGGDASFQNLDLRLEVLEEQLNLPFTFVSGHIHELIIHVPWVKITSEPIVVTINTIECILNLKDQGQAERNTSTHQGPGIKAIQGESPPGYIKSIVTKVINNITINCNNLILKYVEEDIVLSVNVRFLSMQTVNELWEPTFTDVSSSEVALRKIVTVEDLTLCLDKMDTAGKIETYQDPVLYRCSMLIRLMMNYHSNVAKCASLTRFDLHCERMEFSMTEQQLPMLLRLIALITSLQTGRSGVRSGDKPSHSMDERGDVSQEDEDRERGSATEGPGWSGWAWNTVTSFLPVNWDPDWADEQSISSTGHVIHMGVYVDEAVLSFKTVETVQEQLFYKPRKIRYNSFLTLRVTSAVMSMLMRGVYMNNLRFGLGSVRVQPQGVCSCGHQEVLDGSQPPIYVAAGTVKLQEYLKDSLFDKDGSETTNWKNYYSEYDIDHHLATVSVESMLEKSAAFGMDIIHSIEIADDFPEEKLLEFESNFEYSNFPERKVTRYVVGDLKIQLCTGLMHRIETIKGAAKYDHTLYASRKPEPSFDELPPVTVEEYEALRENVSVTETYFNFYRLALQLQLTDHSVTRSSNPRISVESRFGSAEPSGNAHLSVECSEIVGSVHEPMYAFRLASCASRQMDLDPDMLNDCYSILSGKIRGLQSQLYLNKNCHTMIVVPCNAKWTRKSLVYPQYFRQSSLNHDLVECEIEDVTVTGTRAKLMLAASIVSSIAYPADNFNPLFCSSLFTDACNEKDSVFLELSVENVLGKRIKSSSIVSMKIDINSIKAFALNGTQQAFVLSGPENDTNLERENGVLLSAILQYSESIVDESNPSILSFIMSETRSSFDPLLCEWLRYQPIFDKTKEPHVPRTDTEIPPPGDTSSDTDVRKKIFRTLHESVHSLSDKDKKRSNSRTGISGVADESTKKLPVNEDNEIEELQKPGMSVKIAQLYPFWRKLVLCGSIGHFVMYVPTATMDGVGVAGIEPAKDRALDGNPSLHIIAIKLPTALVHSVNVHHDKLSSHLKLLPSHLPLGIWSREYRGFPWTLKLKNLSCYSLKKSSQTSLVRSVDLNATIDVTTKSATTEFVDGTHVGLGLCVYVDTSPIVISMSEDQIAALTGIASEVKKVTDLLSSTADEKIADCAPAETEATYFDVPKTPSSYNPVVYPENTTSPSSISTARDSSDQTESDSSIITAMIQWTIAKMSLKLYTVDRDTDKTMKLLLELEDIITTLDWQPIYVKFKNKITTARICHFTREAKHENWELGDYAGLIMLGRESSSESEDTGFLSVTYTKAQSGNVHTRWGAQKHQKFQKIRAKRDCPLSIEGYITEIDTSLQRVDIILPPSILHKFVSLLRPFLRPTEDAKKANEEDFAVPLLRCDNFNNKSLPLIYLEFKGMNLMVPTSSSLDHVLQHDLLMIQLDGISITPSTENPICRTVLRSDVYQLAAQSNILNIPGSSVEDRQYQVNVRGICACTTTWQNYQQNVPKRSSQSYLYTMNENPALEWNNLSSDGDPEPQFSTSLLMSRIDVRLIIAPAVVLHPSKIICGGAFELTCLTDIDVAVNVDQMKLMCRISTEINDFLCDCSSTPENVGPPEKSASSIARQSSHEIRAAPLAKDQEPDFAADSGIDFESTSVNYRITRKRPKTRMLAPLPLEILVNCGSVNVVLHIITAPSSEDKKCKNEPDGEERIYDFPYLHFTMIEPNFYISQLNEKEKIQISCFDVALSLRGTSGSEADGTEPALPLIETKSGSPHPNTGIPASFVVLKSERKRNASTRELFVEVGRPTRINCSMVAVRHIDRIRQETAACCRVPAVERSFEDNQPQRIDSEEMKLGKFDLPELGFKTRQLVIRLEMKNGTNVSTSVARSSGDISRSLKSDRINGNLRVDSLVVSSQCLNDIRVFLNPSFFRVEASIFWETWQDPEDEPQITIQAQSDGVYFEIGPQQIKMLDCAIQEYNALADYLKSNLSSTPRYDNNPGSISSAEQHYKDDLKAGAFQFVEGSANEMPSPYQVVFYTYPEKGMTWRYPQPRIITGLHVSPIPFEISDNAESHEEPVRCSLEYWSESHGAYRRHAEFELSETDSSQPEPLPCISCVHNQVASVWRVTIMSSRSSDGKDGSVGSLAPQALVGCLRVDSYFDPSAVPNLRISVNIASCRISICGQVDATFYDKFPEPVAKYRLNAAIPETQRFAELEQRETSIVMNGWQNGGVLIDARGILSLGVLDYGTLEVREVIERLEYVVQVSASHETNVTIECNPVTMKYGPSIAHTIAVATSLWTNNNERSSPILTRVCVANDTNVNLRFGQAGTTDCVQLRSRECHFYCWCSPENRTLRVAVETATGWTWSQAFAANAAATKTIHHPVAFANSTGRPVIFAKIEAISATQKLVTITASLVITNRLVENFQMRLVELREESRGKSAVGDEIFWIGGNDQPASIALENTRNMAMRLRFATATSLAWTGDIPLKSNSKLGQPWLVKVPLQDRGQFLSIWVRIVEEMIHGYTRILVVMSPLYMIRSYLPVPVVIKIETPSLGMSSNATIQGQGKVQQLYCPGTFEHCHQLTFQFESSTSASNPYVPLSYNSIEERTFFARPRNEDIDAILAEFEKPEKTSYLPFQANYPNVLISADQPQTHVQIKYRDAGFASSTLLLELQPWCFIFNTLGCHVAILAEDTELCQIPHNGIVTPPKLEGTFHLRVTVDNTDYVSPALQLARPDWNPGFYMPRIRGLVPVDGNIQASIECQRNVCVTTVNSKMHEDMRILRIMASHVLCNLTPHEFHVACLAVADTRTGVPFPDDHSLHTLVVSPCEDRSQGIPIVQWRMVDSKNTPEHDALYISLRLGASWSCPIRVDRKVTTRRCTAISDSARAVPVVITTQEDEGTSYVIIHVDDHPQFYIENSCPFPILLGEANPDGDGICEEASHFAWRLEVQPDKSCYYTTPSTASRMPDSQTTEPLPKLRLCVLPSSQARGQTIDESNDMWSRSINMSNVTSCRTEQYVRLPVYGDIKLLTSKRCHTICLRVVCMSQVEVSAHDIRTRLILEESKSAEIEPVKSSWLDSNDRIETASYDCGTRPDLPAEQIAAHSVEGQVDETCLRSEPPNGSATAKALKGSLTLYVRGVNVTIMQDMNESAQRVEVASLCLSDLIVVTCSSENSLTFCACVGDLQLDNQMFEQGGFDFPVVFMSQNPYTRRGSGRIGSRNRIAHQIEEQSLLFVDCTWKVNGSIYACTNVNVKIGPISAYIEDTFVTQLLEYTTSSSPPSLNAHPDDPSPGRRVEYLKINGVSVPEHVINEATNLRTPLRLEKFTIEPISVLLSVHTSIRLYVALDHSPLYFGAFEREHLATTPGGLANALTMHYLSGALFGAGWVVGSLEILGSPGGFAQALGSGLKDFVTLPIQGILRGPWSFLIGITQGSASLMKHLTAGTVNSVTKLASSVARNLDRLTLDAEHLQRQEESRRTRPQGMAQGLYQGLTGFGMSLLAAVAGLAHHPLQQVLSGAATPRGLVTGVGLGIVGAVTKPLSGAAELVALTGQGLLEGTGWNPLPTPRQRPVIESVDGSNNSSFKCVWRLLPLLANKVGQILHVTDAECPVCEGVNRRVVLILTRQTLVVANLDDGSVDKIYLLRELTSAEHILDPSLLCLYCLQSQNATERNGSPIEYPEMDQAMRVRVEQFVRGSSTGCASFSSTYQQSDTIEDVLQSNPNNKILTFHVVEADARNYFLSLFEAAKRQDHGSDFIVL